MQSSLQRYIILRFSEKHASLIFPSFFASGFAWLPYFAAQRYRRLREIVILMEGPRSLREIAIHAIPLGTIERVERNRVGS